MSPLRIAFCGPNRALNYELVQFVRYELRDIKPVILEHPAHEIADINDPDWSNLWRSSLRNMAEAKNRQVPLVLSASCGIDEVVEQAVLLAEAAIKKQSIALPDSYSQVDVAGLNKIGSILQVILNQTEQEVVDWWTNVYAVLPTASKLSVAQDEVLTQYDDFLTSVPAFQDVQRLPDEPTSAKDLLKEEVENWKTYLGLS